MEPDVVELMTFQGWFVRGFSTGRGIIVVRPQYVAFLPTEPMKHLGTELAKGVAFSAAGIVEIKLGKRRQIHLADWANALDELPASDLDAEATEVAGQIGGIVWPKGQAKVVYKSLLFRRKKGLWFVADKESMRVSSPLLDPDALANAQRMLDGWES
jgi:hypothetical protein